MQIKDISQLIEKKAPLRYQESYDNAGLIVGDPAMDLKGVLVCLDSTEEVLEEAIRLGVNMVVAHHPIVFKGLKKINGKNYVERVLVKAIKHDLAIYAAHTNLDNVYSGVNFKIAEKLGLEKVRILSPKSDTLCKLTTFIPPKDTEKVLRALGEAGAGQIGEYKNCSFQLLGKGRFQPTEAANPHIGQANQLEEVDEHRVEVIFPIHLQGRVLSALKQAHPYEEVAYYLHLLQNSNQEIGSGAIGELAESLPGEAFLAYLKEKMALKVIRHTALPEKPIQRIAVCGGSGSFLLSAARRQGADVFVTADFKYHEFFDAEGQILIADIGHYESEIYTNEIFRDLIKTEFPDLPLHISQVLTNPIQYYY